MADPLDLDALRALTNVGDPDDAPATLPIRHLRALLDRLDQAEAERDEWESAFRSSNNERNKYEDDSVRFRIAADRTESQAHALQARIDKALARHRRTGLYELCTLDGDSCTPDDHDHMETHNGGIVHADQRAGWVCEACRDEDGDLLEYPCPTVRTLTEGDPHA